VRLRMNKPTLEKTYRVLEVIEKGERTFFPQERFLYFFWRKMVEEGYTYLKEEYQTLDEANEFLYQRHLQELNKGTDKEVIKEKQDDEIDHPFDAVFYRLQKPDKLDRYDD